MRDGGYLLFSDPNANTIYQYSDALGLRVFREHSGYDGADIGEYGQPGSNGLTLDRQGRLTINEHGRHRVSRLERDGSVTVLAANYQGKRLNSPNDLVYRSDGSVYFTDPPFGLPKFGADPRKELPFSGVFRWQPGGRVTLLAQEFSGPNGIAFSPDEKTLYVGNWDARREDRQAVRGAPRRLNRRGQGVRRSHAAKFPAMKRSTASRSTRPATSIYPRQAACGSSTPRANISAPSSRPRPSTTSRGVEPMARRCTCARAPISTAFRCSSKACGHESLFNLR